MQFYDVYITLYHYIVLLDSMWTILWCLHHIVSLYCVIGFNVDNSMVFTSHCITILCYWIQCLQFNDVCITLCHYVVLLDSIFIIVWCLYYIVSLFCVIGFNVDNSMVFTSHCITILCYWIQCLQFYGVYITLCHYVVLLDSILIILWCLHHIVSLYCVIGFNVDNSMVFTSHCITMLCYWIQCLQFYGVYITLCHYVVLFDSILIIVWCLCHIV